ncbi:MAG: hypothetical protein FJZ79_01080 [Chlorobi bacterium]|nr:hypothetical protein [Chlorobiota bacterium]
MKLFGDLETRKRVMKKSLPVVLAIAWAPILWLLFMAVLVQPLLQTTGSMLLAQAIVLPLTAGSVLAFLRVFRSLSEKIYR